MSNTSNETQPTMQLQAQQERTQSAEAAQGFLQSILDTGREPFLVLDATLNVVTANRAFYQTFAADEAGTVGRFVYDLGDGQWNIPVLRRLLEEVLPKEAAFEGYEVTHDFPGVGTKTIRLNGRKLYRPGNHTSMFLLALEDVTGERAAETARREAEERFELLVEGAHDYAMILLNTEGRIESWNTGAQRILGYTEDNVLGQPIDLIFTPEDQAQGSPALELARAKAEGRAGDMREHLRSDGTRFWADGVIEALHGEDGRLRGFAKILRDATERRQAEEALRAAGDRAADILESITDAFFALDQDWRFTYLNDQGERLLQRSREGLLGKSIWDEFPEAVGSTFEREYRQAISEGKAVSFEEFYPPLSAWFEVRAYPSPEGLSVYFHDIDERKALAAEQSRLADANRLLLESTSEGIYGIDVQGRFTFVNRAAARMFGYVQEELLGRNGHSLIHHSHSDSAPYPEADCPIYQAMRGLHTGHSEDENFWRRDGTSFPVAYSAAPILEDGTIRGAVITFSDISKRKLMEAERAFLLAEVQGRAERETLLNRIGITIRASDDPGEIQQAAVTALAEALGADRCYFAQLLPERGISEIKTEYCRPDLSLIARQYAITEVPSLSDKLFASGSVYAVPDTQAAGFDAETCAVLRRLNLRSLLRLPLREGTGQAAALVVAMADGPRTWTPEEIALVEAVATQTRTAVADARVRLREHRIATQLQDALQPPLPASAPGLALGKYYEAALDEAGVGGDFFDVFPISATCTALVVGDLSGKGLAAAAQVSTVRNMLRATLYLGQTVAEAIVNLNNILADNGLLSGFATLFVGVYDASSGLLRYVNCGQEPGLVRRAATGKVEMLNPTGPVLGAFPGAAFTQDQLRLCPGDALALFTDGLTEAGPSRASMLELEGVAALLAADTAPAEDAAAHAEALTLSIIDSVDRFAESGVRDDVCLLVAVATA